MFQKNELEYALKKVGVKALIAPGSRFGKNYYNILQSVVPELSTSKPGELNCEKLSELRTVILADDDNDSP